MLWTVQNGYQSSLRGAKMYLLRHSVSRIRSTLDRDEGMVENNKTLAQSLLYSNSDQGSLLYQPLEDVTAPMGSTNLVKTIRSMGTVMDSLG